MLKSRSKISRTNALTRLVFIQRTDHQETGIGMIHIGIISIATTATKDGVMSNQWAMDHR